MQKIASKIAKTLALVGIGLCALSFLVLLLFAVVAVGIGLDQDTSYMIAGRIATIGALFSALCFVSLFAWWGIEIPNVY